MAAIRPGQKGAPSLRHLRRPDLPVDTIGLARYLIGKTLVHDLPDDSIAGRIIETEAYPPGDAAGHAFRGPTPRNRSLYLERGHAYVYFIYGSAYLLNVSSEVTGVGAGVLLRSLEPLAGMALMERRRGTRRVIDLARGPGRLAAAMWIDRHYDGMDLCDEQPLWLGEAVRPAGEIGQGPRIGLTREAERPFRFYERGNPFVSGPARMRA